MLKNFHTFGHPGNNFAGSGINARSSPERDPELRFTTPVFWSDSGVAVVVFEAFSAPVPAAPDPEQKMPGPDFGGGTKAV